MDKELEKLKKAVDEFREVLDLRDKVIASNVSDSVGRLMAEERGFHIYKPERVIGKVEDIRSGIDGIHVNCRCVMNPLEAPRHSGRYPWKDDDNEIREVFNMDSKRLNRFVTMLDGFGGSFRIDQSVGERATAHIDIPCDILRHLHVDGDGSTDIVRTIEVPKIPPIRNIQTFNDRVVQITFADGTQTKSVCGKDETFDLYEGIAFCLFKRFLGKNGHKGFNDLMRYAFRKLDEQEKVKAQAQKLDAENKRLKEKKKLQAERRKVKKREEKIGIFIEALRKNREVMMEEGWSPMVKPDKNPYITPGEPEPPVKPDENPEKEG